MSAFEDKVTEAFRAIYDAQCLVREAGVLARKASDVHMLAALSKTNDLLGAALEAVDG